MSLLPFDQIVAKLDKWNAQRLATIMERSTSVDDEQRVFERSVLVEDDKEEGVGSNVENGDQANRKNICKPMASSTPLVLSPTSMNGRRQHYMSSGHSVVSTISKCSTENDVGKETVFGHVHSMHPGISSKFTKAPHAGRSHFRDKNQNLELELSDMENDRHQKFSSSGHTELTSISGSSIDAVHSEDAIFQDTVRRLTNSISVQENQMAQASAALTRFHEDGRFGTMQELGIQRVLLLANARWKALNQEMNRLKTSFLINQQLPKTEKNPINFIYIHYMKFLLNRNYCVKTNQRDDLWAYMVLCKYNEQVFATQVTTVIDMGTLRDRMVAIRDLVRFENLPADFQILVEIYGVTSDNNKNRNCIMSFTDRAKALLRSPKSSPKKKTDFTQPEDHGLAFRLCGYFHLNRDCIGMHKVCVQEAVYPLDGTVEVRITSSP